MPPGSICVHKALAATLLAALAALTCVQRAVAADDASAGYEAIRPALVKVWAFDPTGRPQASGTGIVVDSSAGRSLVLTATHVVAGAAAIRIDVSRELHDLPAQVERTGPRDLTLLTVDRGGLRAARFAPATRAVVEGNVVAIAGYVKNDELIGVVGQAPRVLFPGTVSSRPDDGMYLELENVQIEEGLSGGAVFDPRTGDVLGVVTSRTSDRRGGFADSGALVVVPFLVASHVVAVAARAPRVVGLVPPPTATPRPLPPATATPRPLPTPSPPPVATPQAAIVMAVAPHGPSEIASWLGGDVPAKRFEYRHAGCGVAVTLRVQTLQFVVAHQALVPPQRPGHLLAITLGWRAAEGPACADVAAAAPLEASYEPTAMSFDGHHVTMRFVYAGDPANAALFPADASPMRISMRTLPARPYSFSAPIGRARSTCR
jgi:S1-C subfamily serine protease